MHLSSSGIQDAFYDFFENLLGLLRRVHPLLEEADGVVDAVLVAEVAGPGHGPDAQQLRQVGVGGAVGEPDGVVQRQQQTQQVLLRG